MKALITDHVHSILLENLEAAGVKCTYLPTINQKEVEALIAEYQVLVINSKIKVGEEFLSLAKELKVIGRLGSGLEIIDLPAAKNSGVAVVNSPEGNRDAVAEHAIGMLLSLFNNLQKAHRDVIHFDWHREENRGEELKGKTVGIIGFGNTGQALADKLSGFDLKILFYDKYKENFLHKNAKSASLEEIQNEADIITFHVPYNAETHYYLDDNFISQMRKNFYLINTSRGKIVNQNSLLQALDANKIKGACLDVFENEKIQIYSVVEKEQIAALNKTGKTIFTTHVAGWTNQSKFKLGEILSKKIITELS
jgi:D-3-phosphoglycerate dehydrogenase